jgi:hypothetical protein
MWILWPLPYFGESYSFKVTAQAFKTHSRSKTMLGHFDNFTTVYETSKALCVDLTLSIFSLDQLIPPIKEEIASNELEPRCEQVLWVPMRSEFQTVENLGYHPPQT